MSTPVPCIMSLTSQECQVYQEHSKINSLPILCHFTSPCLSYITYTEGDLPFKKEVESSLYV